MSPFTDDECALLLGLPSRVEKLEAAMQTWGPKIDAASAASSEAKAHAETAAKKSQEAVDCATAVKADTEVIRGIVAGGTWIARFGKKHGPRMVAFAFGCLYAGGYMSLATFHRIQSAITFVAYGNHH